MIYKDLLDDNGESKLYIHSCPEGRKGQEMTPAELDDFARSIVKDAYASHDIELQNPHSEGFDFFEDGGQFGFCKDIVVRYMDERGDNTPCDIAEVRTEDGRKVYPVIICVKLWCSDSEEPSSRPCGAGYFSKIYNYTLTRDKYLAPDPSKPYEIVCAMADAWNQMNPALMKIYLANDLNYSSSRVWDVISSKEEYLDYLSGQFKALRDSGVTPKAVPCKNRGNGMYGVLIKTGDVKAVIEISAWEGVVRDMMMIEPQEEHTAIGTEPNKMDLYAFEFQIIPHMVSLFRQGKLGAEGIVDKDLIISFAECNCDTVDWDWSEVQTYGYREDDGTLIAFYKFPYPTRIPMATFAATVMQNGKASYYTLESSFNEEWVLGLTDEKGHHNLGNVKKCDSAGEFLEVIRPHFTGKGKKGLLSRITDIFKN